MTETDFLLSAAGHPLPKRWLAIIATIWAGQAVSMVTSYAAGYAAVWYVTETTGSALMLSLMSICAYPRLACFRRSAASSPTGSTGKQS